MNKQNCGYAWITVEFEEEKFEPLKLKLQMCTLEEAARYEQDEENCQDKYELHLLYINLLCRHVLDWNLTIDGEKIPCTRENIDKWIPRVLSIPIKNTETSYSGNARSGPIFWLLDKSNRSH